MKIIKKFARKLAKFILSSTSDKKVEINISEIRYGEVLKNRNIIITGGGSGIGLAMAKKFDSEKANVVIIGRNEEKLKKAVLNSNIKYLTYDLNDIDNFDGLIKNCRKKFDGEIDTIVCNAGISLHEGNICNVTKETFDMQFSTNFRANYFLCKKFSEYFLKSNQESGNILIISSETGDQCYDTPYGLTKSSLNSLVRALSRRFYKSGLRVNAIAPGVTESDMTKDYADVSNGNYYRECASDRIFLPTEVAEVATFIISDASKCISGEIIHTNAGNHLNPYWND